MIGITRVELEAGLVELRSKREAAVGQERQLVEQLQQARERVQQITGGIEIVEHQLATVIAQEKDTP